MSHLQVKILNKPQEDQSHKMRFKSLLAGAQPALHFGGGGNFHEILLRHRAYSTVVHFRKRSQIKFLRNNSEN